MPKQEPSIHLRLAEMAKDMESRVRGGDVTPSDIRAQLSFYFHGLAETLQQIVLSEGEALLLCDSLNGVLHEPHTVSLLWAGVADSIELEELDKKWGVDGKALVEKLRAMDYWQALSLIDAVTRWWNVQQNHEDRTGNLRAVGLIPTPRTRLEP